jgi:hypothetical protein
MFLIYLTSHSTLKDIKRDIGQQSLFDFQRPLTAFRRRENAQNSTFTSISLDCLNAQLRAVNLEPTDLACVSI